MNDHPHTHREGILITRSTEDYADTAYDFETAGFRTYHAPMIEIEYHDIQKKYDTSHYSGLIITSRHGIKGLLQTNIQLALDIPLYLVGERTKETAITSGFTNICYCVPTVRDLIQHFTGLDHEKSMLYARGQNVTNELKDIEGLTIENLITYSAKAAAYLPNHILDYLDNGAISCIAFYSTRTAKTFRTLIAQHNMEQALAEIKTLCISDKVVECFSNLKWKSVHVCATPDHQSMLRTARDLSI